MADALLLCFVGWWVLAFYETKETKETQENSRTTIDAILPWSQNSNSLSLHSRCPILSFFTKSFGLSKTIRIFVDN